MQLFLYLNPSHRILQIFTQSQQKMQPKKKRTKKKQKGAQMYVK